MESLVKKHGLTHKQAKFCRLVMLEPEKSQTDHYLSAFPTKSRASARSGASNLMAKSNIKAYIKDFQAAADVEVYEKLKISKERILQEEACIAFFDPIDLFDKDGYLLKLHDMPEHARRALARMEVLEKGALNVDTAKDGDRIHWRDIIHKINFQDKGAALNRLEKVFGMQKDVHEVGTEGLRELLAEIDGQSRGLLPSERDED